MNTVIIINLNGNALHVEEPGVAALRDYLGHAEAQLAQNPDRLEIMADLEQAIAEKCAHFLEPHKNVLTVSEMQDVLRQMGPVQTDAEPRVAQTEAQAAPEALNVRRLYQIRERAVISGICAGLAAYFNIDVTVVRIVFVGLAVLSHGIWILVYVGMMLVIPFANTDEERAAATGAPFNAQEVIERAKKHYAEFKNNPQWRHRWRQQGLVWGRKWREGTYWWGHHLQRNVHPLHAGAGYGGRVIAGLLIPILAILSALLFGFCILAFASLATSGTLFGWTLQGSMPPLWVCLAILVLLHGAISQPLRHARRAVYFYAGGQNYFWYAAWDGMLRVGILLLIGWVSYTHVPQAREFFDHLPENWQLMWNHISDSFQRRALHGGAI